MRSYKYTVSSRLNRLFSRSASSLSICSRFGCNLSRFRYSAFSLSAEKSAPTMSPIAVRRIQSVMACSDRGKINRFKTIASLSMHARFDNPAWLKIASNPNCRHI